MISIVFVSNYFNHHEKFFCDELNRNTNVLFTFIQTELMDDERIKLGWGLNVKDYPYVICSYGNNGEKLHALQICKDADVLILGSAPYEFVEYRIKHNKLTFYYAERLFRKGLWHMLNPTTFLTVLKRFIIPGRKSNFYLLAASAYTALDTFRIHAFNNRRYKWGHFIEVSYPKNQKYKSSDDKTKLLWVGRFIPLKHPDYPILIAAKLKKIGANFTLNIIGAGVAENSMRELIERYNLESHVTLYGSMQPLAVRKFMEESDIYLFTSDFNEGWGAVLGEAMTSGCAVVASHGSGATPFLVKHKENGLIYETGNYQSFENNVLNLVNDRQLQIKLSTNAINTMITQWNPSIGAERFYELCKSILCNGEPIFYQDGPISEAAILKNSWFKDDTI